MKVKKVIEAICYETMGVPVRNKEDALDVKKLARYYGLEAVYRVSYFGDKAEREARAVWIRGNRQGMKEFRKALELLRRWDDFMGE